MNLFKKIKCLFIGHSYEWKYKVIGKYKNIGKKVKNKKYSALVYTLIQYKECSHCHKITNKHIINKHLSKRDLLCRYDINIY